jgi:hypothetical protein
MSASVDGFSVIPYRRHNSLAILGPVFPNLKRRARVTEGSMEDEGHQDAQLSIP